MNQWFVEAVDRFTDQSINASAHSADPLRPATARRATNSARTSWLGRPTQATGVEGATGRERGDAISGHIHRRIVVPIGPCPTQSINSPAHSALPTACRATLSPARSARPPSSGGSHGGWCSTRPGSLRHRKIVVRTIAIFQDNCCHGLGFNQFVTKIILKNGYGPPTPQSQPRSAPGRWLGHPAPPDPDYCRVSFAAGHCSCSLLGPARGDKRARLLPGRRDCRQRGGGRARCSAGQNRAVRCREVLEGSCL